MVKYFSVDCDLTLVQTDTGWLNWLLSKASELDATNWNLFHKDKAVYNYNLATYFPSVDNPMEYWNDLDYDQFQPLEGSIEALERINHYFPVIFTSHIEGSHGKSKANWIKKHYPFQSGIIYTREKSVLCGSVVGHVDDRLSHLKGFEITKRYLFNTKYLQDTCVRDTFVMETIYDWKDLGSSFVNDLLKMWR